MPGTAELENFYYYKHSLIWKLKAAFDIGQKVYFFEKVSQKIRNPLFNPFSKCFASNKVLHNFRKSGQHSIVKSQNSPD